MEGCTDPAAAALARAGEQAFDAVISDDLTQFSLKSGELFGAEALVRWQHPRQGLVAPAKFIPLAEESGLIVALGEWVQHAACSYWAGWVVAGLNPGVLSINVSGVEFRRGQIPDTVRKVLDATSLPTDAEDCAIVRVGHSLQLKVIAEGVETEQQREFLVAAGCDEMQGYLRGKPMPAEDFRREFLGA